MEVGMTLVQLQLIGVLPIALEDSDGIDRIQVSNYDPIQARRSWFNKVFATLPPYSDREIRDSFPALAKKPWYCA